MKALVKRREIKLLVHFTRIENLKSILENGLKSRQHLEDTRSSSIFNDEYRLDGHTEAICCSITHPNYKMFYRLRKENPEQEWVVLGIKKSVIWKKDCAFCIENAACSSVTSIPLEDRKGKKAFKKIFEEYPNKPTREKLGISDDCPTNPQAEVLIFDDIEPKNIFGVVFQSKSRAEEYKKLYDDLELIYHKAYFYPRSDHANW